jgi:hypothetical protein
MNRVFSWEALLMQARRVFCSTLLLFILPAAGVRADEPTVEYVRVTNERAAKIVATLALSDPSRASRVQNLIAQQYRDLSAVHDARDVALKAESKPEEKLAVSLRADADVLALHRRFIGRLIAELTPEQVDRVKDGLTYGVVPITYRHYRELLPNLSDEQSREILANLLEAREYAMDAGSADEKHAWFGKYKGRINNYLSKEGIDLKAAEKAWAAAHKN